MCSWGILSDTGVLSFRLCLIAGSDGMAGFVTLDGLDVGFGGSRVLLLMLRRGQERQRGVV